MSQLKSGDKSPQSTVYYGRGGAGNITAKSDQASNSVPETTPTLKSKTYTTGRGGTGNMAKNDSPEEARAAQDVEVPDISSNNSAHHVGRGGAANTYTPNIERQVAGKIQDNGTGQKQNKESSTLKDLAGKAKETLSRKKQMKARKSERVNMLRLDNLISHEALATSPRALRKPLMACKML